MASSKVVSSVISSISSSTGINFISVASGMSLSGSETAAAPEKSEAATRTTATATSRPWRRRTLPLFFVGSRSRPEEEEDDQRQSIWDSTASNW